MLTNEKYAQSIQLVELHLPSLPELPPHRHKTNGLPPHLFPTLTKACQLAEPSFSNILKTLSPDLLIYDVIYKWPAAVASSQNIPPIQYPIVSAASMSVLYHIFLNPGVPYPFPAIYNRELERSEVNSIFDYLQAHPEQERPDTSCSMMLTRNTTEIEGKYIDYIALLTKVKTMPVGTLVRDPLEENEHMEVVDWLNKKDPSSVVLVSFGSEHFSSKEEMEEIAHGLELSKVNFIWVIRFPEGQKTDLADALPDGFLERVRDSGLIVEGWAPQARILTHSSVGGFVSHCGWSSTMESMKFGVPIIGMPMRFDQPFNARLVVELGLGMEVKRDNEGKFRREEIAKVITEVVVEKIGEGIRRKAREFGENMRIKGEGEMDQVVEELVRLCKTSKGH